MIGNYLGHRPNYAYMKEIIEKIWRLKGGVKVSMLENGVFVFCFNCEQDETRVLEAGPWMIAIRLLILRAWSKEVALERTNLHKVLIWVSLPGLPFQYWSSKSFNIIGSMLDKPLYIDSYTKSRERLAYDRLCIEIDASEPLQDVVIIEKENGKELTHKVLYEWKLL